MTSSSSRLMTSSYFYVIVLVGLKMAVCACPQRCSCGDVTSGNGSRRVDCRGRALADHVLASGTFQLPAEVEELDVGRNRISTAAWLATMVAPRLIRLYADRCEIRRIGSGAFSHFRSLEYIDLSFNHVEHLAAEAFSGLPKLRTLRLDNNRLKALRPNVFRGLTLSILRLDENLIQDMDAQTFRDVEVETLNLDGNRLVRISGSVMRPLRSSLRNLTVSRNIVPLEVESDAFVGFSFAAIRVRSSGLRAVKFIEDVAAVESLDVGDNDLGGLTLAWSAALALGCREARLDTVGLERFDASLATSLRSARSLDLSANRLSDIDPAAFRPLADLHRLDLSRNQLARLPPDFSRHLSTVQRLNLSSNAISRVEPTSLARLTRLRHLDLSRNRIQVLPDALETVLAPVELFDVSGNPLHCNCEVAWLRRWLGSPALASRHPDDAGSVRCRGPRSSIPLLDRPVAEFTCSAPEISSATPSRNVRDGLDVVLACTADGDPAPNVRWESPFGDVVSVSPPDDRQHRQQSAIWKIRRTRPHHSGWYRCNASNIAGSDVAYTYLHVFAPEVDSAAEMSGLVYPMIPLPVTTPIAITATTSSALSASVDHRFSTEPETNSTAGSNSTTGYTGSTDRPPNTTLSHAAATSSAARDRNLMTSRETADVDDTIVVVLVVGVSAACLLVFISFAVMVFAVRRHRRSGKYDPSRPPAPVDGCRRICAPCWPAADSRGSTEVLEFDASTVRLKLDTSALSGTSTAGDRSDTPLTNRVTTCPDPVQQTLIGPPSTNAAQSR